ncbi:c-type cytochrome biogenesis protein CcmI [Microbulbifer flavimaris]|uniref:C-type cytochrome biogenesis protein CcmI n=1 Tax=Microbulbifer flavimaris TaxID=1781068 RepID=A0ABX4HXD2_9GAMM|nr:MULTISPECIES: c-type cytochrome biogenesis protein CcmI [Microbulbifer]KUJ80187.1 cytochrome C biogenesis protein CcmI [Microbulbifer sp. ZGT114]PCO04345.1 c-type cytochrome biogenesis protein CcmI [Microbulbifer flavimaris]
MTELWLGLALLALPLAFVILWPALRGAGVARAGNKRQALATLYREQRAELQASLEAGAIDSDQFAELEAEMARNLLSAEAGVDKGVGGRSGRALLIGLAVILPLAAALLYLQSGHYQGLQLHRSLLASQQGAADPARERELTEQLKAWTSANPDDLTSRFVLAQRLMAAGDLPGAVAAYRYVAEREPQAGDVKAELAQALFFAAGSKVTDEVRRLVDESLALQPRNGTALGLAGIAAFEDRDYAAARVHWQRALAQLSPDSMAAQALAAGVARAERALAQAGEEGDTEVAAASAIGEAPNGAAITVNVSLAEGVAAAPDTPVFVYARGADSPMPLAIVRLQAGQLPAEVVLDESRAMMPGRSLGTVESVQLVARLAVHGDARPAPGDWQGMIESLPEARWGEPQAIRIDREL